MRHTRSRLRLAYRADNDAEVVRRAVEHLKDAHGETTIRENMVDNIKARIRDEANAA